VVTTQPGKHSRPSNLGGPARNTAEHARMAEAGRLDMGPDEAGPWYRWGPYLSERAWGTVREDYSADGDAWSYFPYEHARSRAYRWNEEGLAGLSDIYQDLCLAMSFWNGRDSHLKERIYGLTGPQGNHGEDAKDYWWYLDATPSHSYLKWRYHYPQAAFPYDDLRETNARRNRSEPEYELLDTGIFDEDRYWRIEVEYAKTDPTDICIVIKVTNEGPDTDTLHVLPHMWFRDTWTWGRQHTPPQIRFEPDQAGTNAGYLVAEHWRAGVYRLAAEPCGDAMPQALFCDNTTNRELIWNEPSTSAFPKDAINDHVVSGQPTVNPTQTGTKSAWWYQIEVPAGETREIRLRLWSPTDGDVPQKPWSGSEFDAVVAARRSEADEFFAAITPADAGPERAKIARQALAGMIWSKQFYRYNLTRWLDGDPGQPAPPEGHTRGRNTSWRHFDSYDVLSMPDPWEYPWFAVWDLAFHTVALAHIDPVFAKYQLLVMTREWFMHPNGALPAYEWSFDDTNPPVHAWAALRVYEIDGGRDDEFLRRVFHKLLINFTWWVNRVDRDGNNVFEGGFLGLDNIGPVDRSHLPPGVALEQADGTSWMAFYCLTMCEIAMRLAENDPVYSSLGLKFLEHFTAITDGASAAGLWDPADGFFYDLIVQPDGTRVPLRVKSLVGVVSLFAVAQVSPTQVADATRLRRRFANFLRRREIDVADLDKAGFALRGRQPDSLVLTLVDPERLRRVLVEVLDEGGMLSPYGIRSLSARHRDEPFSISLDGSEFRIEYEPGESNTPMYGGNSNWRGPVWFPMNHLLIHALRRYGRYLGTDYTVEYPTHSGQHSDLHGVADSLSERLVSLFRATPDGPPPCLGTHTKWRDPKWGSDLLFHEYFNGDVGHGLGASHQTGWTGLVADLILDDGH